MPKTLTVEQKYLLSRILNRYLMRDKTVDPDPEDVKRARRLVMRWDSRQADKSKAREKRVDELMLAARDAVYFSTTAKAMEIIKKLEALKP